MEFGYIGISYKNANQDIRGRAAFSDSKKMDFLQEAARQGIDQCMVLSTCNRSEVFFFAPGETAYEQMKTLYLNSFPKANLLPFLQGRTGKEAVAYLFYVAAGMESMVAGEDQVLGQVKEAHALSKTLGYTGKELNKVVRSAVTCAKKIKTELKISEHPLSVSYIGIKKLDREFGIRGRRAFVIGSGSTAALAIRYLYEYGAKSVCVCSRNAGHAGDLQKEFPELAVTSYEARYGQIAKSEIIISATASLHYVIKNEKLSLNHKAAFLDLAAPRDIEPAVKNRALLFDLDSLNETVEENKRIRQELLTRGRAMAEGELEETLAWLESTGVDKTIESLQQRCDRIAEDSYTYLNRKLNLNLREQKLLKKILKASLKRLLREPILELKQTGSKEQQQQYQKILSELFGLEREE